jgi:hypothetical protein
VESLSEFSRPSIPKTGHGLYIIVPYKTPRSEIPSTDDLAFECEIVTDMWLERCLDARALVPPESHVASTPFPKFPLPGKVLLAKIRRRGSNRNRFPGNADMLYWICAHRPSAHVQAC